VFYSSFLNQAFNWGHYLVAFIGTMVILPRFLFRPIRGNGWERFAANFSRMVLLIICLGYVLVATKLFEVLSLTFILAALSTRTFWTKTGAAKRQETQNKMALAFYDGLDIGFGLKQRLQKRSTHALGSFRVYLRALLAQVIRVSRWAIIFALFGGAVYLRFTGTIIHSAPVLSDSYVTLAWMKYIDARILFHDGIYPQGFHIYLGFLRKFAAINPLYVLNYTGPLNSILTMLLMTVLVTTLGQSIWAGFGSALVYGLLSSTAFINEWTREVATNSQEFAFVLLFPAMLFLFRYLWRRDRHYLWIAGCAITVMGLVHTLAYALAVIGACAMLTVFLLARFRTYWRYAVRVLIVGVCSAIISVLPLGLGTMLGRQLNKSASSYASSVSHGALYIPTLHIIDYVSIISICLLFVASHPKIAKGRLALARRFVALWSLIVLLLYEFGDITHYTVLTSRSDELWALVAPLCIGMAGGIVWQAMRRFAISEWLGQVIATALLLVIWIGDRPQPIEPYRMQWDETVDQFLRIGTLHLPKTWMIVGDPYMYDLVLGEGFALLGRNFLQLFAPQPPPLTLRATGKLDTGIPQYVFIFVENKVLEVRRTNSIYSILLPQYRQRQKDLRLLNQWIQTYRQRGGAIHVFFTDPILTVYEIDTESKISP